MSSFERNFFLIIVAAQFCCCWLFVGNLSLVSQVLLIFGLYILILICRDREICGKLSSEVLMFSLLLCVLNLYILFSALNNSYHFETVSNSFQPVSNYSGLPSSVVPYVSLSKLSNLLLLSGLVGVGVWLYSTRISVFYFNIFTVINSLILSIVGIFIKLGEFPKMLGLVVPPFGTERYFFSTFTYKNHWSIFIILSLCCAFSLWSRSRESFQLRILLILSYLIFPVSIVLSGSRSCTIICFCLLFVFLLVEFLQSDRYNSLIALCLSLLIPATILCLSFLLYYPNFEEFINTSEIYLNNIMEGIPLTRYYLTRDTFHMFKASPLYGWGLGSFEFVFNYYDGGVFKGAEHFEDHYYIYAHNDILQTLAELGIVGFILFFSLLLFPFIISGKFFLINHWVTIGIVVTLLYSFVEFPFRTPAVSLFFTVMYASNFVKRSYE